MGDSLLKAILFVLPIRSMEYEKAETFSAGSSQNVGPCIC
jgi:hypothetical protein